MITPRDIWDSWRDNDLLSLEPPNQGESYPDYRQRVGDALDEDRLFHFVIAELCTEELSREEVLTRLYRAIGDLTVVSDNV